MLQLLFLERPRSVKDSEKVHPAPPLHWMTTAQADQEAALCGFTVREKAKAVLSAVILPDAYLHKLKSTHI